MAVVTIHAVVDVSAHAPMIIVRGAFRVTVCALKHAVIIRIGMAGGAHPIRTTVVHGKVGVIEDSI